MKKKKIWSTITRLTFALMFVASWAVLGVALALKTAKIEIGGGITFTATEVYAKISGSVTGSNTENPIDEHPIEIDSSTSSDFTVDSSWTNMNLDFQNASTPIVVTITIENKSSERPFWIVLADNIEQYDYYYTLNETTAVQLHNTDVVRKINGTTNSGRYLAPIKLEKDSSVTLETTISIHDANYTVDDNFKLGIELIGENAIKDEGEYTKLTFTTNDTDKTASVKASSTSIKGEVIIPALISKNGEVFTVDAITRPETTEVYHEAVEGYWDSDIDGWIDGTPEYYETVYSGGFANCTQMTSIYIPATITSIAGLAFAECTNSTTITFECYIGWKQGDTYDFDSSPSLEWFMNEGGFYKY